ncbi:MAG: hypothetical protein HOD92_15060 [Deltaproteobacteria bacterium]|jgi:hypothetical protein|nr:hypothetical protein [Deltaproteobacteria bacterium]MBT4525026.1 hypothetical protein [Deltaproteobacteria bacterium]MBT5989751.1 hypothetical protein [Bacteroidota bacterium]
MKPLIKNKVFYLNKDYSNIAQQNLLNNLAETKGISEFEFKQEGQLKVVFDLMIIRAEKIELLVNDAGIQMSNRLFDRLRRDWRHFLENNEYDNMVSVPRSCCKLPKE